MGGRAAVRAVKAGLSVTGFDPVESSLAQAAAEGVSVTSDPLVAGGSAKVVMLFLPLPKHVKSVVKEVLLYAEKGTIVVDLSTIDPETARWAATTLLEAGITYLDAPVLGRPEGCGTWTLVVGGPEDQIAKVSDVLFRTVAAKIVRVGEVGAGSVVKLLNNLMFGTINAVTAEVLTLCVDNHVDPGLFVTTIAESGAATVSNLFKNLAPRMVSGNHEPIFSLNLLAKDNRLAVDLAHASRTAAPIANLIHQINESALEQGFGARDSSAVHSAYRQLSYGESE
jgi:3-hydroxyisobutyrate dehydrogenase